MPGAAPSIPTTSRPCRTTAICWVPDWLSSDPFLERVRPARGYGEIGDTGAGYFEWQADRQRQIQQSTQAVDDQRRVRDIRDAE